ncbi:MAG: hypothetical protein KJS92_01440 [Bacteroidetes bacterium]|nr:hypothetical protein [Bacteroidota bacterium]
MILATALAHHLKAQKTVSFTGGARSVVSNNRLHTIDSIPDTTTVPRNTNGYALIDLGVNIRPNKSTEILGMFRIRNQYGGFWGAGVSFDVRQLWLKGIVANAVRYQLGDLNLKQTPFTLYNHHADRPDSMPDVFLLQQRIVDYERFYSRNTWRQQGLQADFGLNFAKYLKELDFSGYLTRLRASNFSDIPDRLMGGATVQMVQSKHLALSWNGFSVFDVRGTATDTNRLDNRVQTASITYTTSLGESALLIKGESGTGRLAFAQNGALVTLSDYFIYLSGQWQLPFKHLSLEAGYMNIGPDFRSIGAQSKDINYQTSGGLFNRYANGNSVRSAALLDLLGNEQSYQTSVSSNLLPAAQVFNAVLPYGTATFNRLGGFGGLRYVHPAGISFDLKHHQLREIRGQGTLALKTMQQSKANLLLDVAKMAGLKRSSRLRLGLEQQRVNRESAIAFEQVNFRRMRISAGAEVEVFKKIDLMFGFLQQQSKGQDFIAERDEYTRVRFLNRTSYLNKQQLLAAGIRCRFEGNTYFTAFYQKQVNKKPADGNPDYRIEQFSLIYNMSF